MALTKFNTNQYEDKSITSAKLEDNINVRGNLTVQGDLNIVGQINRDQTSITETTLAIQDSEIKLRAGTPVDYTPNDTDNALIIVERGTQGDSFIKWDEGTKCWCLSKDGTNVYRIITNSETSMSFRELGQADTFSFTVAATATTPELKITSLLTNKNAVTKFVAQTGYKHSILLDGDIDFNTKGYIGPNSQTALTSASSHIRFYTPGNYLFYSPSNAAATISLSNSGNSQTHSYYVSTNDLKQRLSSSSGNYYWYNNNETLELMKLTAAGAIIIPSTLTANGTGNHYIAGNLGIGITPTQKLHVSGNAIITGTITSGSTLVSLEGHTHPYDNYVSWNSKIGANAVDAVTSGSTFTFTAGSNITLTRTAPNTMTIAATDTNTATAVSDILSGSNSGTAITYAAYATDQSASVTPKFYTTANNPTGTSRLNVSSKLYATELYDGGTRVAVQGHTHSYDNYVNWRLQADAGTIDNITSNTLFKLVSGSNIQLTRTAAGTISIAATFGTLFEDNPTNGELSKGPTSNWAYDHVNSLTPHANVFKAGTYTFTGGATTKSWNHGMTGNYAVTIGCSDPQRHVYYTKNGTSLTISLDEGSYFGSIEVSVVVTAADAIV